MKIILAPDSFKGTMSAATVCAIMRESILRHIPEAEVLSVPIADGGEGTVDAFLEAVGGERVFATVQGPYGEDMRGFYAVLPDGTAVVEMAACAGLPLAGDGPITRRSTYGVGQLMRHALEGGCKRLIVGLGGSATNDGGAGAAAAMGVRFLNRDGVAFVPVGGTLDEVAAIDASGLLRVAPITAMCDIDNPLYGETGAAVVFGPQKGADAETVAYLDGQLRALAAVIHRQLGLDVQQIPGSGAAGGMGAGMTAFCGAVLAPGIETVLAAVGFSRLLRGADWIFTGEGRLDAQSLRGKTIAGVVRAAAGVRVLAVVGAIGDGIEPLYDMGLTAAFGINRAAEGLTDAMRHSRDNLRQTMDNIMRLLV